MHPANANGMRALCFCIRVFSCFPIYLTSSRLPFSGLLEQTRGTLKHLKLKLREGMCSAGPERPFSLRVFNGFALNRH